MADNSISSPKPIQSSNAVDSITQNSNPSLQSPTSISNASTPPSMEIPQISSPQLPLGQTASSVSSGGAQNALIQSQQQQQQQQQMINQAVGQRQLQSQQMQQQLHLQQQQQQQQQNMISQKSFQIQPNLQRSPSMSRLNQMPQQQQAYGLAANSMMQQAGMYGQMSFGGSQLQQQQQQQQQQMAAGGLSRSALMGQAAAHLPMIAGQNTEFNLQSQLLGPAQRQKAAALVQGSQFHQGNNPGQTLHGMQALGMMGSLGLSSQLRANGSVPYVQQRINQGQMRQQQLSQQNSLTSQQKLQAQNLTRSPSLASMNSQLPGLAQNGQQTMMQNAISQQQQQQWLRPLQPGMSASGSPYHLPQQQRQQQAFLQQQPASSPQMHPKSMPLTSQQISQLVQQQPQLVGQQTQLHQLQQQHQHSQQPAMQLQHVQQQSPRMPVTTVQKSISLTGSQPGTPSGTTITGGSLSHCAEASNQLLGKRKIQDLVSQVDPRGKLDPELEDLLLEIADDFIDSVTTFACSLAKHRKSSTLESKDVLLHLEKNWHLSIPGFTSDEQKYQKKANFLDYGILSWILQFSENLLTSK
ncbi:hypothetical protein Syun_000469 [Stephania yunnanensis]|uniref:Transcription initiation factor TFIID subunit 12 domain-containing protein n=1 Tax=Stephania yunnanensis TaxID=152371 RepID=A0AAP0LG22_9MAGN